MYVHMGLHFIYLYHVFIFQSLFRTKNKVKSSLGGVLSNRGSGQLPPRPLNTPERGPSRRLDDLESQTQVGVAPNMEMLAFGTVCWLIGTSSSLDGEAES